MATVKKRAAEAAAVTKPGLHRFRISASGLNVWMVSANSSA